ncbi:MAG: plasmid mobilization protein [Acidimicrobiales bacterium]
MLVWEVVEWDDGNEAHATRHGVAVAEIEQVLGGGRGPPSSVPTGVVAVTTWPKESPTAADACESWWLTVQPGTACAPSDRGVGDEMIDKAEPTTESERADDHYAHRDDEDRWAQPVGANGPEQLSVMVSARFSRSEADQLGVAAEAAGMSRSAFVRQATLTFAAGRVVDVARVKHNVDEAERHLDAARQALG